MSGSPRAAHVENPARAGFLPRSLRIPFVRRCTLISRDGERPGLVLDLSLKGVYVATEELPEEGDSLTVCFRVPGNDRLLSMRGQVAWVNQRQPHPVHSLPPGFGLAFADPARWETALISATIEAYCGSSPMYRQYI